MWKKKYVETQIFDFVGKQKGDFFSYSKRLIAFWVI